MKQYIAMTLTEKRSYLSSLLHENEVVIEFNKVSGEKRVMPCTLMPAKLPTVVVTEGKREVKINPDVIRVFCTDKQAWRSFRLESVTNITIKEA